MVFNDMSSARLSDGRPQFLAARNSGLYSIWKPDLDPDGPWSGWQPFASPFQSAETLAGASLTDGRPQIFAALGDLWTTWKVDPNNSNSAWADWTSFHTAGAIAVGAATLNDGRPQIFFSDTQARMWSTWKVNLDPNAAWEPMSPFPSPGEVVKIVSVRLTDGRPQLLVRVQDGEGALLSTWKANTDPNAAWVEWQPFTGPPDGGNPRSIAGTSQSDGIPMFVAAGFSGRLWRTHKVDKDPNAAWSNWIEFPVIRNADNVAAASLTDGRPQILIDTPEGLFSTWQQDVLDPETWVDPQPFENPPGT
ncbi:MAG: hypothetical protein HOV87_11650 [Catenulispora sp.]|nr:hypothetical protein [Catenulispora sp.]